MIARPRRRTDTPGPLRTSTRAERSTRSARSALSEPFTTHRRRTRGRHRATAATRVTRISSERAPATVWLVAQSEPLPGTALPGWLGRTLITLVTTYTRPGDRVLLITPPTRPRATRTATSGVTVGWFGRDEFAQLEHACWALTRLGRGVHTTIATQAPDYPDAAPPSTRPRLHLSSDSAAAVQSESGPRDCEPAPNTADNGHGARPEDRERGFDLVVTATHPSATDWLRQSDWVRLLTPTGLVAVITYGDITGGRLQDGVTATATTLREHSLLLWDHIALLTGPVTDGSSRAVSESLRDRVRGPHGGSVTTVVHSLGTTAHDRVSPMTRTHHDLLLFLPTERPNPADTPVSHAVGEASSAGAPKGDTSDD